MKRPIKSIIIDDEKPARDAIHDLKPDLIFLDIQMPKISGFEMLELLELEPVIIFTTAFDEFAVKAFEVNATDYLLKPFSPERFKESIERAYAFLKDKSDHKNSINKLIQHRDETIEYLEPVVIKTGSKIRVIPIDSVYWIEAQDDYVMIHCTEGKYLKQKTMKFLEKHLNPRDFIRIHRSYIVRISHIKQIEPFSKMSYQAILTNGISLPLSKSGIRRFGILFDFIFHSELFSISGLQL